MNAIDSLLLCADAVAFSHHGADALDDAEIEMGVCYELYTCDLARDGSIDDFQSLSLATQVETFFEYLAPKSQQDSFGQSCLDRIPRGDWIVVFARYHANLLRAFDCCDPLATGEASERLAFAVLSCGTQVGQQAV